MRANNRIRDLDRRPLPGSPNRRYSGDIAVTTVPLRRQRTERKAQPHIARTDRPLIERRGWLSRFRDWRRAHRAKVAARAQGAA